MQGFATPSFTSTDGFVDVSSADAGLEVRVRTLVLFPGRDITRLTDALAVSPLLPSGCLAVCSGFRGRRHAVIFATSSLVPLDSIGGLRLL